MMGHGGHSAVSVLVPSVHHVLVVDPVGAPHGAVARGVVGGVHRRPAHQPRVGQEVPHRLLVAHGSEFVQRPVDLLRKALFLLFLKQTLHNYIFYSSFQLC